jgi:hypothetical protein
MNRRGISLFWLVLSGPFIWSATRSNDSPVIALNEGLGALLSGAFPVLALLLVLKQDFSPSGRELRFGQGRRRLTLSALLLDTLTMLSLSFAVATALIIWLRGTRDPLFVRDLLATASLAVAASVSLLFVLSAAYAWFKRPGPIVLLIAGWTLGHGDLPMRLAFPSGHIRYLVGAGTELPLAGWGSLLCLYGMAAVGLSLLLVRVRD